jgi:hypothetical protein
MFIYNNFLLGTKQKILTAAFYSMSLLFTAKDDSLNNE